MQYDPGDLVIMTHPLFDEHVVAEIVSTTAATCRVRYFHASGRKSEEPKQRKLNAILGRLRAQRNPQDMAIALAGIVSIRNETVKTANGQYLHNVKSYIEEGTTDAG